MVGIEIQPQEDCSLITLSGEIDHATAPELEEALLDLIRADCSNLVLNFGDVTYISSAGLRALAVAQMAARRQSPPGQIIFAEASPVVKQTFELVGFYDLFESWPTDAQALRRFAPAGNPDKERSA
jgi:anti-sigma B factor antagonist